ncbi:DUF3077 domain-containing protein [Burkholderia cenocepacia]|uniref:DUF3077 domain-containing protein n=1 Tax=Burkholderia cenocepacia TaxID=95486 RepID=UPI00222EA954|nr:DUF3077 domain-containing protein [Burkholderia cenocepacia]MCW3539308.1 DUF3077 domain-containing protein [Burkholderia cenocepacia]
MVKPAFTIENILTQSERVGRHENASLYIRGELRVREALEEASIHLCSVIEIAREAACESTGLVALHGAVTLAEISKALVDAVAMALLLAERNEVSNG